MGRTTIYMRPGDSCADCPLHWSHDDGVWMCGADLEQREYEPDANQDVPGVPDWCPLREGDVVVRREGE